MNYFHERLAISAVMSPKSIATTKDAISAFCDTQSRKTFHFGVALGPVAADAAVKVELLAAAAADGVGAASVGEVTYTGPEGGVAGHLVNIAGHVSPLRERYLAVRITNNGAAAQLACAMLLADSAVNPEETDCTMLVV